MAHFITENNTVHKKEFVDNLAIFHFIEIFYLFNVLSPWSTAKVILGQSIFLRIMFLVKLPRGRLSVLSAHFFHQLLTNALLKYVEDPILEDQILIN